MNITEEQYFKDSKEISDYVSGSFFECVRPFLSWLKKGEHYWLEYLGNNLYTVRSDNNLGKNFEMTEYQLVNCFKKVVNDKSLDIEKLLEIEPIRERKFDIGDKILQKYKVNPIGGEVIDIINHGYILLSGANKILIEYKNEDYFEIYKEPFDIKCGDLFICLEDVCMEDSEDVLYHENKIYQSDKDGCITDEKHNINHIWKTKTQFIPYSQYFIPVNKDIKKGYDFGYQRNKDELIDKCCNVLVSCIDDFMCRRMETWHDDSKKATLENIRKTLKEMN